MSLGGSLAGFHHRVGPAIGWEAKMPFGAVGLHPEIPFPAAGLRRLAGFRRQGMAQSAANSERQIAQ
jgi:hypothetical protein